MTNNHNRENRRRLAAIERKEKEKNRHTQAEAKGEEWRATLQYRHSVWERVNANRLQPDELVIVISSDNLDKCTLFTGAIISLLRDEKSVIELGKKHLCVYTEPWTRGVRRTQALICFPLRSYQTELNQVMAALRRGDR